jgi:4'-phosphopantetheinyl transferase EntD
VLEVILPTGVVSEECFGDALGGELFGEEHEIVAGAVEKRRQEFATVRILARACLSRLELPPAPILPGAGGAPIWPAGVHGSMTHCDGYAAAAVGLSSRISAIGIDAEPDAPLPDDAFSVVATPAERDCLAEVSVRTGGPSWDRLLFSAKEAVYKAWFPLVGEWLDFQEVEVSFDSAEGTFMAAMLRPGLVADGRPVSHVQGRWLRERSILLTAVVITRA